MRRGFFLSSWWFLQQSRMGAKSAFHCSATSQEHCIRSWYCAFRGGCELDAKEGVCRATSSSCLQCDDSGCVKLGSYVEGKIFCQQTSVADCARVCDWFGGCTWQQDSYCAPSNETDCRQSKVCQILGACSFDAALTSCMAKDEADCKNSTICKQFGVDCHLSINLGCLSSWDQPAELLEDGEQASPAFGLAPASTCEPVPGQGHCPALKLCEQFGHCGWDGDKCVPRDAADCRMSLACLTHGWCGQVGDRCGAVVPEHCERCYFDKVFTESIVCRPAGVPVLGRCVPRDETDCWYDCSKYGRCTLQNGRCVASSGEDCQNSLQCQSHGACVLDPKTKQCAIPLAKP